MSEILNQEIIIDCRPTVLMEADLLACDALGQTAMTLLRMSGAKSSLVLDCTGYRPAGNLPRFPVDPSNPPRLSMLHSPESGKVVLESYLTDPGAHAQFTKMEHVVGSIQYGDGQAELYPNKLSRTIYPRSGRALDTSHYHQVASPARVMRATARAMAGLRKPLDRHLPGARWIVDGVKTGDTLLAH